MIIVRLLSPGPLVGWHHQSLPRRLEPTLLWNQLHSESLPGLAHFGQALPVLIVLIRLLAAILRIKLNALLIFENLDLHAFRSDHLLVARGIGDITDDNSVELAHVDQRGTNVAGTECRKNRCLAEIFASGIANGGCFAVIVRMVFLH